MQFQIARFSQKIQLKRLISRYRGILAIALIAFIWILGRPYLTVRNAQLEYFSQGDGDLAPFSYTPRVMPDLSDEEVITSNTFEAMANYCKSRIAGDLRVGDFSELSLRVRLYAAYFKTASRGNVFAYLEGQLFGWWLGGRVENLLASFIIQRGIVMTTGNAYLKFAIHAIRTLRLLSCNLPIHVIFNGNEDLSIEAVNFLRNQTAVQVTNLSEYLDTSALGLANWDVKPFALLFCPFEEAILMDADTVWMQNPEVLFNSTAYQEHGALFFKDRTLFSAAWDKARWLASLAPEPLSVNMQSSRILRGSSIYEQEAGVVVVNKRQHLIPLLTTCLLNLPGWKEPIRAETHGEKETFWLGWEMSASPYSFSPFTAGAIGTIPFQEGALNNSTVEMTGHLAHAHPDTGDLLWFNDGIVENKRDVDWAGLLGSWTHFGWEGSWTPYLTLHTKPQPLCQAQIDLLEKIKGLFSHDPLGRGDPVSVINVG